MKLEQISIALRPTIGRDYSKFLSNLITWLNRRGSKLYFLDEQADLVGKALSEYTFKNICFLSDRHFFESTDLIISLGGDGTLIGIARKMTSKSPAIFSINSGHLGFITEFNKINVYDYLSDCLDNKLSFQQHCLFRAEVYESNRRIFCHTFVNDAVISKTSISRIFSLNIDCNNEPIYSLSGDGIIVSSPLGSTAYSLAAGGPITHPQMRGMILTPICPHSLSQRPIVLPESYILTIRPDKNSSDIVLTLDGQVPIKITHQNVIKIKKEKSRYFKLIKNPDKSYFRTLKEKFILNKTE